MSTEVPHKNDINNLNTFSRYPHVLCSHGVSVCCIFFGYFVHVFNVNRRLQQLLIWLPIYKTGRSVSTPRLTKGEEFPETSRTSAWSVFGLC